MDAQKLSHRVGPGGSNKVDRHIPWDALSGAYLVLGPKKVFWGCGGDLDDLHLRARQSQSGGVDGGGRAKPLRGAAIPDRL